MILDLFIIISRYLFVLLIAIFAWQSIKGSIAIDKNDYEKLRRSAFSQRAVIIFMHALAFSILSFDRESGLFDYHTLGFAGVTVVVLVIGSLIAEKIYKNSCPIIWNCIVFLLDLSLISIYRIDASLAERQLIWIAVAFGCMIIVPVVLKVIPFIEKMTFLYFIASFVLILSPFFIGRTVFGATRWVQIGNIGFQPSEIVKFLFVFYLASALKNANTIKKLIVPGVMCALLVLIHVLQRDLGGALIFFLTFMAMMYIASGKLSVVLLGFSAASAASVFAYQIFYHVRVRVSAWSNPLADMAGDGFQILQSLFAIGTWGPFGSGLTRGFVRTIPVVVSDFIFAAISEEFGWIFAVILIIIFMVIFYRGIKVSLSQDDSYFSLLTAGFTCILAVQTFLIIGGVTKLIPLTGVTLPFVSYGGSSILASVLIICILQWVYGKRSMEEHEE
ncbi:MAG: FtsW/RodA/SpoVE family cell cycle protein [Defluviitaleaceae bacterium]|nr:FtsW/RodA/SpoVE family cell cycle protein [Defluviitaleaceae bacterium]